MKRAEIPFNIKILALTPDRLKAIRPVSALDIMEGSSENFHPNGLFSTEIFGRVGDQRRNRRFSYVDVKVPVFHPVVYNILIKLKRIYADIMAGTLYATWDENLKDFVKSNAAQGDTGFEFFVSHWQDIAFSESKSAVREQSIALLRKYKDVALTTNIIVMPAGLRDLEIDQHNRKSEDEINQMYRTLIKLSNTILDASVRKDVAALNVPRYQIQICFNQIYEYISSLIEGKKKLLLGRWASRNIFNGTRNVITAIDTSVKVLGAKGNLDFNSTVIGLYQYMKATLPVTTQQLRELVAPVFPDVNQASRLINKQTLQSEEVMLASLWYDRWATNEGIAREITKYQEESIRNRFMEIEGRYMFLIYKGPDMTFRLMSDIRELPSDRDPQHVSPITFTELMYLAVYKDSSRYPVLVTRYPVSGVGSIYPSSTHMRVTIESERRTRLDENWQPLPEEFDALEFPVKGSAFMNSLVPHSSRLGGLGADFDGDTCSANIAYSEESVAEYKEFINSRRAYVGTDGKLIHNTGVSTIQLVLRNMTGFRK